MTGRLFIHIGPPKTATTSLQVTLQTDRQDWFVYGGTNQPRKRDGSELSHELLKLVEQGSEVDPEAVSRLRADIETVLASGRHLLLSEELLLVNRNQMTFEKKLRHLGEIIGNLKPVIIVCLREPLSALQSLYQELRNQAPPMETRPFEVFAADNQALVYQYDRLIEILKLEGLNEITAIRFEDVTASRLTYKHLFGEFAKSSRKLMLMQLNRGKTSHTGRERSFRALRLRDHVLVGWLKKTTLLGLLTKSTRLKRLLSRIAGTPIRRKEVVQLELPAEVKEHFRCGIEKAEKTLSQAS